MKKEKHTNANGRMIKEAAALRFSPEEDTVPRLIASGKGEAAEKILETARENNIPVYKDDGLAHVLNQMNIGDEIPPQLYEVVAEILVFISNMDRVYGEKYGKQE